MISFVAEEVNAVVKDVIDQLLSTVTYSAGRAAEWSSSVIEAVIKKLAAANRPFKYFVTCAIIQKTGAGIHTAAAALWDASSDGMTSVRWESKTMYVIVTVGGVAL